MTSPEVTEADRKRRRHRTERIIAAGVILLAMVATGLALLWDKRQAEELGSDRRYIPGRAEITPEIELLQEYVRIDTSTPAGAAQGARWLVALLAKNGVQAEIIQSAPDRLNVYARIKGRRSGEGLILFNHIDVVPPGEGWSHPAFKADIAINMLWGRGALDMKGLALCQLFAFLEVARLGNPPEHDLVFLATADEETGSEFGMRWIIANRPDVLAGMRYGLTEGGITEMMSDRITYFGIETAGKQLVELTLVGPDLRSLQQARIALEPHMMSRDPQRIMPIVRQYFRDIAPTRTAYGSMLADIDAAIERGDFWFLPAPYRDLTQDSVWAAAPARVENRWIMKVKLVNLPDTNPDARIAWLGQLVEAHGVRIDAVTSRQGPVPVSPHDTPLFRALAREAEKMYGAPAGIQVLYRSTTDSRFLRPMGIVCYGICPYPVDFYQSNSIHKADERIGLDGFLAGIRYLKTVVREWAGPGFGDFPPKNGTSTARESI